jgi:hypothetical protein
MIGRMFRPVFGNVADAQREFRKNIGELFFRHCHYGIAGIAPTESRANGGRE